MYSVLWCGWCFWEFFEIFWCVFRTKILKSISHIIRAQQTLHFNWFSRQFWTRWETMIFLQHLSSSDDLSWKSEIQLISEWWNEKSILIKSQKLSSCYLSYRYHIHDRCHELQRQVAAHQTCQSRSSKKSFSELIETRRYLFYSLEQLVSELRTLWSDSILSSVHSSCWHTDQLIFIIVVCLYISSELQDAMFIFASTSTMKCVNIA